MKKSISILGFLILGTLPAAALQYYGYTGTTVYNYTSPWDDESHVDTFLPLRLRVAHPTAAGEFSFAGNGRLYKDLGANGGDLNGRVYAGTLGWESPGKWVTLTLGRQYVTAGVTAANLDGGLVTLKAKRAARLDIYGGSNVPPNFGPMRDLSRPDGRPRREAGDYWLDTATWGGRAGVQVKELWKSSPFGLWFGGGASFAKRAGHESEKVLGLDAQQDFSSNLKTSEELHYDNIGKRWAYEYYSLRYRPTRKLSTYADYRWSQPKIAYTSIFSVFAHEPRSRTRVGAQYKISEALQPFADYSYGRRGANPTQRIEGGLDQNFDYAYLRYGGLWGTSKRAFPGGREIGGFLYAEFPKVIPSWERLGAGASLRYKRYKDYGVEEPPWENLFWTDVHARLNVWKTFDTTLGAEYLSTPTFGDDFRAYLQAQISFAG